MEGQLDDNEEFSLYKYVGEYFREASVLIFVFGFLDPLIPHFDSAGHQDPTTGIPRLWAAGVIVASVFSFALGTLVEWLRKR